MANKRTLATMGATAFTAAATSIGMPLTMYYEGRSLVPYLDSVGVKTWCDGETQVGYKEKFTHAECDSLSLMRYGWYSMRTRLMYSDLGAQYVTPPMHAAFTDMSYNVGVGTVASSSMIRRINAGNPRGACDAILLYKKAGQYSDCSKTKGNPKGCYGVWTRRLQMNELCIKGMA